MERIVFFLYIVLSLVPGSSTVVVALTKSWYIASVLTRLVSSKHQTAFYVSISQSAPSPFLCPTSS